MDINELLIDILVLAVHVEFDNDSTLDSIDLASKIIDLDRWFVNGGFTPKRWEFPDGV